MSCLFYLLAWPFILIWNGFKLFIYFMVFLGKIGLDLLGISVTDEEVSKDNSGSYKKKKKESYKDLEFDEKANLWGVSEKDK